VRSHDSEWIALQRSPPLLRQPGIIVAQERLFE
jgi:hypothetical protein